MATLLWLLSWMMSAVAFEGKAKGPLRRAVARSSMHAAWRPKQTSKNPRKKRAVPGADKALCLGELEKPQLSFSLTVIVWGT